MIHERREGAGIVSAEPEGWADADADSARLALELECLLTDKDVPMPALSRWWDSAHEALELHRQRMASPPPASAPYVPLSDGEIDKVFYEHFTGFVTIVDQRCVARAIERITIERIGRNR